MIFVLWLARVLWRVSLVAKRAGDWLYGHCFSHELKRLERESDEKAAHLVRERHRADELTVVTDRTLVEHIGGPDDGERRPVCDNGSRRDGLYVVVGNGNRVIAKRYIPNRDR